MVLKRRSTFFTLQMAYIADMISCRRVDEGHKRGLGGVNNKNLHKDKSS